VDESEQMDMSATGSVDVNDTSMDFSLSSKKKKKKKVIVDDVEEDKQGLLIHTAFYWICWFLVPVTFNVYSTSLSINMASVSAHGIELSSIHSVSL